MKKYSITTALLLFVIPSFAQLEIGLGVKGGLNVSTFNYAYETPYNEGKEYKPKAGIHAGAFVNFKLKRLSAQPEILFSQQGSNFTYKDPNHDDSWTSNYNYITLPLLVKYAVLQTTKGDINLQVGPQVSRLIKAEANFVDYDGDGAQPRAGDDEFVDIKEEVKSSDFGIMFGAGWDLPMGLSIDARYAMGLEKLGIGYGDYVYGPKNRVFQISIGYKLLKFGKL